MNTKKWASVFHVLFYVGLALGALASLDFRYDFLPEYYSGLLAGIAACFIVGGGTMKHIVDASITAMAQVPPNQKAQDQCTTQPYARQ